MNLIFLLFCFSTATFAEEKTENIMLTLADLNPVSQSLYHTTAPGIIRYYLRFKNSFGNHFLVYEEDGAIPPMREAQALMKVTDNYDSSCTVNLECIAKPFCTGDCSNMYYQISNQTGPAAADAGKCQILSYVCNKREVAATQQAATPQPAPQPAATNPLPKAN